MSRADLPSDARSREQVQANPDGPFGVVINPRSARGRGARAARKALKVLQAAGHDAIVISGRDAPHCQTLVREACLTGKLRGLILIGGDGLIGLVLQVAEARAMPIGVVPAGSGNDFARQFSLSADPSRAVARIIASEVAPRPVDLGVVSLPGVAEHWFAGGLSIGFDAAVNRRANAIALPIGPLRYYFALLAELTVLKPRAFTVSVDERVRNYTGLLATVMNTRTIGGGIPLAPGAKIDDGKLNLVEVSLGTKLRIFSVLGLLARGKHEPLPEVTITPLERVRIEAGDEVAYSDGELVGRGPFEVWIAPAAISLLA